MVFSSRSERALLHPPVSNGYSAGEDIAYGTHTEMAKAPRFPLAVLNTMRKTSHLLQFHKEQGHGVRAHVAGVRML